MRVRQMRWRTLRGERIEDVLEFVRDNPEVTRFFYAVVLGLGGKPQQVDVEAIRNNCIGHVRACIEGIAGQGLLDADVTGNVLMIVLGMINGYILTKLDGWRELPDDDELRTTVRLLWQGIRRTAGQVNAATPRDQ